MLAVGWLVLAYLLVFAAMLREPIASDDCSYFETAAGRFDDYTNGHRMGLVFPVRVFYWIFGYNASAYYAVPFLAGLGLIVTVYALARQYAPTIPSVLAATAFLGNPDFMQSLTLLLPDIPSLFWFCLGVLLYLRALTPKSPFDERIAPFLAGVGFFASWWTKESAALQFLALPLALLFVERTPRVWRAAGTVAVTAAGLLCLESLTYAITQGDALYRYHVVSGHHVQGAQTGWVRRGLVSADTTWWELAWRFVGLDAHQRSTFYAKRTILGINYLALLWLTFAGGALAMLVHRQRSLWFMFALTLVTWAAVSFAVVKLDPIVPLLRSKPRYFLCVLVWAVLSAVLSWHALYLWGCGRLSGALWIRWAGSGAFVACLLCVAQYAQMTVLGRSLLRDGNQFAFVAREFVNELAKAGTPVQRVFGGKTVRALRVVLPDDLVPASRIREVDNAVGVPPIAGTMVILAPRPFTPSSHEVMWAFSSPKQKSQLFAVIDGDARSTYTGYGLRVIGLSGAELSKRPGESRMSFRFTARTNPAKLQQVLLTLYPKHGTPRHHAVSSKVDGSVLLLEGVTPPIDSERWHAITLDLVFKTPVRLDNMLRSITWSDETSYRDAATSVPERASGAR